MECQDNVMLLEGRNGVLSRDHATQELVEVPTKLGLFAKDVGEKLKWFKQEL